METDQLYEEIQETKTAFVITLLVAIYCFSIIMRSIAVHKEWKVICSSIGFTIVSGITVFLFTRLLQLKRSDKKVLEDSE
jgi:hypothetical protein